MEPSEGQSPQRIVIDLEEKATAEGVCPEVGVNPGDIVTWVSRHIDPRLEFEIRFFKFEPADSAAIALTHPFDNPPKQTGNRVSRHAPNGRYFYTIRNGDTELCGSVKIPCRPPGGQT